jgi:hypothetical protein
VLLLLAGEQQTVQFSPPVLDLILQALSKHTVVTLLVRVKDDAEQHAVTAAIQSSPLPAAGFDARRLLFCESTECQVPYPSPTSLQPLNDCQVPVARQLLPTVFVSAHEPSVAEVHRLESKRGFVRSCIAVPARGDQTRELEQVAAALRIAATSSRQKTE